MSVLSCKYTSQLIKLKFEKTSAYKMKKFDMATTAFDLEQSTSPFLSHFFCWNIFSVWGFGFYGFFYLTCSQELSHNLWCPTYFIFLKDRRSSETALWLQAVRKNALYLNNSQHYAKKKKRHKTEEMPNIVLGKKMTLASVFAGLLWGKNVCIKII